MLCVACIVCLPRLNWASRFLRDLQLFLRRSQFFLRLTQFCQHVIQFFVEIAYLLFRHHGLSITERSNLNSISLLLCPRWPQPERYLCIWLERSREIMTLWKHGNAPVCFYTRHM